MGTQRRFLVPVLLCLGALAFGAAACSGSSDSTPPSGSDAGSAAASESTSAIVVGQHKGVYEYQNAGLNVHMDVEQDGGTMSVTNKTGRDLPKPGFYLLDARDGTQIDGKVEASTPVANNDTKQFDVTFAKPIDASNIGLVILTMGTDNYGAFVNT